MTTVALSEIVDFYSGGTPSKASDRFWRGDVPWISAKDMKHARLTRSIDHVSDEVFSSTSLRKLPPGTVVMVVRGMILAHTIPIGILEVEAAINQDLKALLPREGVVPAYLAGILRAQQTAILAQVSTAAHGTKKLESRVLEQIRIPLPSIDEQRRIADILDRADALRAKRREALALLDDLTESIFFGMFGSGSGWDRRPLGDLVKLKSGEFLPSSAMAVGGQHAVLGGNGVNGMHDRYLFDDPKIVIGRVGAYCGCVHVSPPWSWVTDNALYVSAMDNSLELPYLAAALRHADLNQYASQSGQPLISASRIYPVEIAVPPTATQKVFAARMDRVRDCRASLESGVDRLGGLFASLQQRAFADLL